MPVSTVEGGHGVIENAGVLAGETLCDQRFQLGDVQIKHLGDQTQCINVFTLVFRGTTNGFHRESCDGHAHMAIKTSPFFLGLHVIRIIKNDSTFFEGTDMVFVGMLIESEKNIRFIARAQNFPGANAHLENRGTTRNCCRNGHVGHDFLLTATCQTGQKAADGLNTIL